MKIHILSGVVAVVLGSACLIGQEVLSAETIISGSPWHAVTGPWAASCNGTFSAIAISPSAPKTIYIGSSDLSSACGVFKSVDGGTSWNAINTGIGQVGIPKHYPPVTTFAVTKDPSVLYVATYSGFGGNVYRTSDAGAHWTAASGSVNFFGNPEITNAISMVADPNDVNTIYAGLLSYGVYKTNNGGQHWQQIRSGGPSDVFHIVRFVDNHTLLTAGGTIYSSSCLFGPSTLGGWESIDCTGTLPISPALTTDGGAHWTYLTFVSNVPASSVFFSDLESMMTGPTWTVLAGTMGAGILVGPFPALIGPQGIFKVTAAGQAWNRLQGLDATGANYAVTGLTMDTEDAAKVFVYAPAKGIFASFTGGTTWSSVPFPLGTSQVNKLQAGGNRLFALTDRGVYFYDYGPDFTMTVDGGSHTLTQGQNAKFTVTIQSSHGFSSPVGLSALNLPPGYSSATWSSTNVTPASNGTATSTLTINTNGSTSIGTFTTTLSASASGYVNKQIPVNITVNRAADFTTAVDAQSRTITQGQSTSFTVTVNSISGFNAPVFLSALNLPTGYSSASWSAPSLSPGPNSAATSTLTLNTNGSTSTGMFTTVLRASASGYVTKDIAVTINIQPQKPTVARLSPASPSKKAGDQTVTVYGAAFQAGLSVTVTFPNGGRGTLAGSGQIKNVSATAFDMVLNFNNNAGTYSIIVNNPSGAGSSPFSFAVK